MGILSKTTVEQIVAPLEKIRGQLDRLMGELKTGIERHKTELTSMESEQKRANRIAERLGKLLDD